MKNLLSTRFFCVFLTSAFHVNGQSNNRHQIIVQANPLTYFYDGVSPFNTKDGLMPKSLFLYPFRGRIRGSGYGYSFNKRIELHAKCVFFQATGYSAKRGQPNAWNLLSRQYQNLGLLLRRNLHFESSFSGFVDVGASLRLDNSFLAYSNTSNCVSCNFLGGNSSEDLSFDFDLALDENLPTNF